jgi:hypothetical protein
MTQFGRVKVCVITKQNKTPILLINDILRSNTYLCRYMYRSYTYLIGVHIGLNTYLIGSRNQGYIKVQ